MNQLPREVIGKILSYLPPSERLNSSLVCRTWADIVSSAGLQDVLLIMCGMEMQSAVPTVLRSQRRYRNVRIIGADLCENLSTLWTKLGGHLRHLELIECRLKLDDLHAILSQCPSVKSLVLKGYSKYSKLEALDNERIDLVGKPLLNVQDLHADFRLDEKLLDQLLGMMPNTTSLSLNTGPAHLYSERQLVSCLLKANRTFSKLDIGALELGSEDLLSLLKIHAGSLEYFKVSGWSSKGPQTLKALQHCTKLKHLSLHGASEFGDYELQKIAQSAPDLEALEISNSNALTDDGVACIRDLGNLRYLGIFWCRGITSKTVRHLRNNPNLQHLDLRGIFIFPDHFSSVGDLKKLETLVLLSRIDRKMFDIICRNLGELKNLELGTCNSLTDADGKKLSSLKKLKCLRLAGCVGITDVTLRESLKSLYLESFSLASSPVTNAGLASIAACQSRLKTLEFNDCGEITDSGLAALLRINRGLESLSLRSCSNLTSETLRTLEDICPRLQRLDIYSDIYDSISRREIGAFSKLRPSVHVGPR